MIYEDDFWSNWWNENWQWKPKYSEKTCPSATLSTTKSHMTRSGLEPRTTAVGSQRLTSPSNVTPLIEAQTEVYRISLKGGLIIEIFGAT
jgi:hypothetical protein